MSDEASVPETPKRRFKFTHEVKFYIALVVGLGPAPLLWKIARISETAGEIIVRPPWIIGGAYVFLACYAAYHLVMHFRTAETSFIPTVERYSVLGVILLALAATHYLGAVVSVDQHRLVAFEPVLALLGRTSYEFADLQTIELGADAKGREVLLLTRKGAANAEKINCDAQLRQVLPRLAAAAKASGVNVVGF
jgi:hypothetical protein